MITLIRNGKWIALALALTGALIAVFFYQQRFKTPSILVIGDSQVSFGSGQVFMEFFENLEVNCNPDARQSVRLSVLGNRSFGGNRSAIVFPAFLDR